MAILSPIPQFEGSMNLFSTGDFKSSRKTNIRPWIYDDFLKIFKWLLLNNSNIAKQNFSKVWTSLSVIRQCCCNSNNLKFFEKIMFISTNTVYKQNKTN